MTSRIHRPLFLLLFLLCQSMAVGAPNPWQESAESYFGHGMTAFDTGYYEAAAAAFSKAIELNPRYAAAYYNRALARFTRFRDSEFRYGRSEAEANVIAAFLEDLIADFNKAIEIDPGYAPAYLGRGMARDRKGDGAGAVADYSKAIRLDPQTAEGYLYRGGALARRGDWAGALLDFEKVVGIRPEDAQAYINRGYARAQRGNLNGAMNDFDKAIEIEPELAAGYSNRGLVKLRQGKAAEARQDFEVALRLAPYLKPVLDAEIGKLKGKGRRAAKPVNGRR